MPIETDWITLDEAATRLGLERSGVFRRAKRGDFGPTQRIGGGEKRAQVILVSAAAVAAVVAKRKAS